MSITNIISLLSGIAFFLFGMLLMSTGLTKVAGSKMEEILYKLTGNPLKGFLLGTGVTTVIQSSSATSVMVVGFVNTGMIKVKQGISVVMGAILGTSIGSWLLCLADIEGGSSGWVSLLSTSTLTGIIAVIGIILRMFSKGKTKKHVGEILLGFAVLLFGMGTMSAAVAPLRESAAFISFLTTFSNPLLGILVGCLFTCIIQSATASIGIVQALAITGIVDFSMAFPLIIGISIGAAVPVLISSIGTSVNGKRTAFVYLFIEVIGAVICGVGFYGINAFVGFPFMSTTMTIVSIAALNTITRFVTVIVQLPFLSLHEKLLCKIFKDPIKDDETAELAFLEERLLNLPAVAIGQCHMAISTMAQKAYENVRRSWGLIDNYNDEGYQIIQQKEVVVDKYYMKLGNYLVKLAGHEITEEQSNDIAGFILVLGEYERIGDRAVVFSRIAQRVEKSKLVFPAEAIQELKLLQSATDEIISISVSAFVSGIMEDAYRIEPLKELICGLSSDIKMRHIVRMQTHKGNMNHITAFNDMLTNYERITDLCSNIALGLIQKESDAFDADEYLDSVKDIKTFGAQRFYEEYRYKYPLPKQALTK